MKKLVIVFFVLSLVLVSVKAESDNFPFVLKSLNGDMRIVMQDNEKELYWSQEEGILFVFAKGVEDINVLCEDGSFILDENEETSITHCFDVDKDWYHSKPVQVVVGGGFLAMQTAYGEDSLEITNFRLTTSHVIMVADIVLVKGEVDVKIFSVEYEQEKRELVFHQVWKK